MKRLATNAWRLVRLSAVCWCAWLAAPLASVCAQATGPTNQGAGQPQTPFIATRQLGFAIPFTSPGSDPNLEVHLYVSEDRGQSWRLFDRQSSTKPPAGAATKPVSPHSGQFDFRASRDGEYWFASRTVDLRRRYDPPQNMLPEMRVLIDTLEPKIDLTVETGAAGEVRVSWKVFDENLRSETLKLEYQTLPESPWQPVAIDRSRLGQQLAHVAGDVSFWPKDSPAEIFVRAEVRDASGNVTVVTRRLAMASAPSSPPAAPERVTRRPAPPNTPGAEAIAAQERSPARPVDPAPSPPATGTAALPVSGPTARGTAPQDPFAQRRRQGAPAVESNTGSPPTAAPSGAASSAAAASAAEGRVIPWPAAGEASRSQNISIPPSERFRTDAPGPDREPLSTSFPPREDGSPPVGDSRSQEANVPSGEERAPFEGGSLPGGERPRTTTSRRFRLEYDVESVGPSGLGKVELWYTRDRGRSWHSKGYDDDKQSPFEVEVDSEGLYGFRILIENGDGLASRMPQPGDMADLWVAVDWSPPVAALTSAIYGVGAKAGQLEIGWRAEDANLTSRPITLSFSEKAIGPWSTIAAGLENTGRYSWKVDPRTPERIFLRLEVRDEAGNVQVDQLREPISIEGLAPRGRIRGLKLQEDVGKEAARPAGGRK